MPRKLRVKILPEGFSVEAEEGETLLEALQRSGVALENVCGGKGICGKCAVKVLSGELSEPTRAEIGWQKVLGKEYRLACQAKILSDIVIEIPYASAKRRAKILTETASRKFGIEPAAKMKFLILNSPTLEDNRADLERLLDAMGARSFDPKILDYVSEALRKLNFQVSAVVFDGELVDVVSPEDRAFGAAFDIGTTTVVGYLYDLTSGKLLSVKAMYNKQISYGEDVISRIEFASSSQKKLAEMQKAVINTLNELLEEMAKEAQIDVERIYDVVCSGNSVMTGLLLGNSCAYAAKAPYTPPFTSPVKVKCRDLGLKASATGYLRTLPLVSAYIGGDVVADILVSELHRYEEPAALIDLGTNGEVVVNSGEEMVAASCAAGPALEGYGIRDGMRGVEGAIESVTIAEDGETVYYRTIGNVPPRGICGSGIIDALAWMRLRGIIDESGRMKEGVSSRLTRENGQLMFIIAEEEETSTGRKIAISQKDVRKIQLAKAAVLAAFLTLMHTLNLKISELRKLFVAGAFGNYIDPFSAKVLGLLPDIPSDRIVQIGNGSGAGASALLLSKELWKEAEEIARKIRVVELNLVPSFRKDFIDATFIPHRDKSLFQSTLSAVEKLSTAGKKG